MIRGGQRGIEINWWIEGAESPALTLTHPHVSSHLPLAPWVVRAYHLGVILQTKNGWNEPKRAGRVAAVIVVVIDIVVRKFRADTYKEVKSPSSTSSLFCPWMVCVMIVSLFNHLLPPSFIIMKLSSTRFSSQAIYSLPHFFITS